MSAESILVGILAVLAIVTLRQDSPDAGVLAESLAAIKDWTFKLGPGFVVGIGNGLILGYLCTAPAEGRPALHPALEAR